MAKQTWNNPIDKSVDWGGDATTGNLPVSGEQVQKFIKETFDKKAGVFHYDNTNNRYLVFADAETRDEFLLDPTKTELVLGTFDAPFNYSAEINLTSNAYNAVFLGSTGNYIDFTFDIKNKQGASTGENVTVTYTFIRNAVRQTVTETRKYGDVVHFNVDKYIGEGTNTVMVGVTGQTSLAATTVAITYQVVNLTIEDGLDISKSYSLQSGSQLVEVPFTVSGYGTKVVEWYLDGEMLPFVKVEDEVVDVIATRTKYITLSNLQQGTHSLQMRAYSLVNGEKFYTNTLYRDLLVYTGANSDVIIGVATTIPREYGVIGAGDSVAIYDMVQYVPYTLRFATYSPSNAASTEVTIKLDGVVKGVVGSANSIENEFVLTSTSSGNKILNLSTPSVSKDFNVLVKETDMNIQEIQSGLTLDFNAEGKTNNSPDRDTWSFGSYEGTLSGFNWNNSSGWVNGRLEMSAGSSFGINYAPLSGNPTSTGKTIEIEWATKNVTNDDAVICDLRGDNGVGILITATKVSMTSADGVTVETEYKSDENVRIGFVINKSSGTTNKQMSFIYTNGIVSRSEAWAVTDNYISDKTMLFTASAEAEVSLKAIRIYDAALTSDNMLNNYTLYRDTIEEMMAVYDRNDVYEEGTTVFSPEKMMNRLPVMIVTGDIPILENTSDKDTQIVVDIEYFNGDKSFTMKSAAMRPQGTSSMGYPKKNFRIYTQKVANTLLYDSKGNLVEDKLYSFKDGAQPVNCWCLKADYAESSGTHNTGIARLWNEALYNAQIDGEYKLRTEAQKKAAEAGYPYDVRTTIDGFPILLFYRPNANADLIFIGKYNFNNDKSTESVFGFEGVPNFDNSRMQCWEVLNNGNALALFTTTGGFDVGWSEAFESRYPDTKTPYTGDLKAFCEWMVAVSPEEFVTEKWAHLDVYKMAAYWCYLMRHAAADQFVKNAMFTSEDGEHFYYILYDNDTINGLINTGDIRIKPTDDRQTKDASGSYVFAGHNSKLWNFLEADEEFQEIVSKVDNALYSAGISYANTIRIFDEEQADKWVERVYNQDAQYKYVGPYAEKGINNLFMLQGKRDLHRRWWLAKRFSIYDAKYVSGTYKSQAVEIKCLNGTEAGQQFSIVAGYPLDYGYGINNVPREFGISLNVGDRYEFTTEEVVNLGDPVRVYGAPNIAELDFSKMSDRLAVVTIANVYDENLGTKLTKLILGNASKTNAEVTEISGLKQAASLEELDVQGMTNMLSLDLSSQSYFKTLKAWGSGVSSVIFAKGAPVERLELPSAMRTLLLEQLPYLSAENIALEDISNIKSITIHDCPNISNDFDFAYNWFELNSDATEGLSFAMNNIAWKNVHPSQLAVIGRLKNTESALDLSGVAELSSVTLEQVNELRNLFGEDAFEDGAKFRIKAPDSIFLTGPTEIKEGQSAQYFAVVFSENKGTVKYSIASGSRQGVTLDENTGLLTSVENGIADSTLVIRAVHTSTLNEISFVDLTVVIRKQTYPTSASISGNSTVNDGDIYTLSFSPTDYTGDATFVWSLTGEAVDSGLIVIKEYTDTTCKIQLLSRSDTAKTATLSMKIYKSDGVTAAVSATKTITVAAYVYPTSVALSGSVSVMDKSHYALTYTPTTFDGPIASVSWSLTGDITDYVGLGERDENGCELKLLSQEFSGAYNGVLAVLITLANGNTLNASMAVTVLDPTVLMTSATNPEAMACMYSAGLAANEDYMTYEEAAGVTDSEIQSGTSYSTSIFYKYGRSIKSFDEFQFFTGLTSIPRDCFVYCSSLTRIKLPPQITSIGNASFGGSSSSYATKIEEIVIPDSVTSLGAYAFGYCSSLKSITFGSGLTKISSNCFYNCTSIKSLYVPQNVALIEENAFANCNGLISLDGFSGVTSIHRLAFQNASAIKNATLSSSVPFGLFYQQNGTTMSVTQGGETFNMGSATYALPYGSATFETSDGRYLDETNTRTLELGYTGKAEDLTPRIKIEYWRLNIMGDRDDIIAWISYTSTITGGTKTEDLPLGEYWIDAKGYVSYGVRTVYEDVEYSGGSTTIAGGKSVVFSGTDRVYSLVQHVNGALYSCEEWEASAFTSEEANGVAVLGYSSGGYVVSKERYIDGTFTWGSTMTIEGVENSSVSSDPEFWDTRPFLGEANTQKIIEALGVGNAPAAEACANYTFPNGQKGYLPSISELYELFFKIRNRVEPCFTAIGGTLASTNVNYWSSTQNGSSKAYASYPYNSSSQSKSRSSSYFVKPFAAYCSLKISCNIGTRFKVTYTHFTGKEVTKELGIGVFSLPAKIGTTATIVPTLNKYLTQGSEQTFTWDYTVKEFSFTYSLEAGVYIQHKSGELIKSDEYGALGYRGTDSNAVALITTDLPILLVAKTEFGNVKWGGYGYDIPTLRNRDSSWASSRTVIDGRSSTQKIIEALGVGNAPAAEACANYTFPNGQKGYLPAIGELHRVIAQRSAINAALNIVGGTTMGTSTYVSSTERHATWVWCAWENGSISSERDKNTTSIAKPFVELAFPESCTSLTITASDVSGRNTMTTINVTAVENWRNPITNEIESRTNTFSVPSESFPQNTSYTDTVEREVSFTHVGVTATTTITQGVWADQACTLNLNDGQWELSDTPANPDSSLYDGVYRSVKSKGVDSGYDTMYIDIVGYETFKLYIRSYGESNYDYVMVSQLDQTITGSTSYSDSNLVKAHTRGNSNSSTAISGYTLVVFTDIGDGEHRITVVYRKDGSGSHNDDRGYVLIPKDQ